MHKLFIISFYRILYGQIRIKFILKATITLQYHYL